MKERELIEILKNKGLKICCAESCTGGLLSGTLINVEGTSEVIDMGFVTYANDAKIKLLGVNPASIEKYGVVSETVACEMASGAAKVSGADVAVGISGIAGPGGSEHKPEGMVCFGYYIKGNITSDTVLFGAIGRQNVRNASVNHAIDELIRHLQ